MAEAISISPTPPQAGTQMDIHYDFTGRSSPVELRVYISPPSPPEQVMSTVVSSSDPVAHFDVPEGCTSVTITDETHGTDPVTTTVTP